ncbi:MAG: hypothetical protein HOO67_00545 [Candidatus Peribacteraceae bacterium]|nr:hypothetical protein [Candidatus Peribacteraceae bacterium]
MDKQKFIDYAVSLPVDFDQAMHSYLGMCPYQVPKKIRTWQDMVAGTLAQEWDPTDKAGDRLLRKIGTEYKDVPLREIPLQEILSDSRISEGLSAEEVGADVVDVRRRILLSILCASVTSTIDSIRKLGSWRVHGLLNQLVEIAAEEGVERHWDLDRADRYQIEDFIEPDFLARIGFPNLK